MSDLNDPRYRNVANDIAKIIGQRVGAEISNDMQMAAVKAGQAAREARTLEDRNKILNQHLMDAAGGQMMNTGQANTFFDAAMRAMNDQGGSHE